MLVGPGVLLDRRDVQAALMGEGARADIGSTAVGRHVQPVVEQARQVREPLHRAVLQPGVEAHLQHEVRDQRDHVGVAAALAQPVDRALHLAHARPHRGQRVGYGILGVVVRMDAEPIARDLLGHFAHDALDFVRQGSAVGVAEHQPARARLLGGGEAGHGIIGIGLVAVEEMLGVEHRLVHARLGVGERVGDHLEILGAVDFERHVDMEVPGLADHADVARLGLQDRRQPGVVGGAAPGAARHAEGHELGILELRRIGEEPVVGRVRARPAALDIVDAQPVELARDRGLVGHGEIDALRLGPVSQGGVEEVDSVGLAHLGLLIGPRTILRGGRKDRQLLKVRRPGNLIYRP